MLSILPACIQMSDSQLYFHIILFISTDFPEYNHGFRETFKAIPPIGTLVLSVDIEFNGNL